MAKKKIHWPWVEGKVGLAGSAGKKVGGNITRIAGKKYK